MLPLSGDLFDPSAEAIVDKLLICAAVHEPWSGRATQEGFIEVAVSGLASMSTAFGWGGYAPSHHGNQRACDLSSGQTSAGHLGHQCSQAPGRPILHLVSSSRRPRREAYYVNSGSSSSAERSLGGCRKDPPRLEVAPMGEDAPGDASQLVGERDRQHVVMQAPSGGLDPGFEPVTLPAARLDQNGPRRSHTLGQAHWLVPLAVSARDGAGNLWPLAA